MFCFCWPAGDAELTATLLFIASFLARRRDYAPALLGGFFLLAWWFKVAVAAAAIAGGVLCQSTCVLAGLALGGV